MLKNITNGRHELLFRKKVTLIQDLIENQAGHNGNKIAIVYKGKEYTYSFINTKANRISQWLLHSDVQAGDRVLLYGINSERLIAGLFGVLKSGAIFIFVNPETPHKIVKFIIDDCTPVAIIVDYELFKKQENYLRHSIRSILLTSNTYIHNKKFGNIVTWDELEIYPDTTEEIEISSDNIAAIIYTSGSSQMPRGVIEPHQQILFATYAINSVIKNTPKDRILCGLPLSFDYGLYQIFLTFHIGATLVLEKDFKVPLIIPRILKQNKVTGFPATPSIFAMLLHSKILKRVRLPDLRYITSTGDVFHISHIEELRNIFPNVKIFPMYGLTECKRVSIMPEGVDESHIGSVGEALPGTQVFVVDKNNQEVSPGKIGELVISGSHIMAGYWNNPHETAKRFRMDSAQKKIMLHSGDFFKKDQDGFLYFIGRDETFIKSRGQKVSPSEIESFLCKLEDITEAAAIGIPDAIHGQSVCVFASSLVSKTLNTNEIFEHCKGSLSPAAMPKYVIISELPLPKTPNGKIDRILLRAKAMDAIKNGKSTK